MKDPLDSRDEPYQRMNDEAKRQGKPTQVSLASRPNDIRLLFGQLRPQAQNPSHLLATRDKLTKVEERMEVDIYFYLVADSEMQDHPLLEPTWDWEQTPLPELPVDGSLIHIAAGGLENLLEPLRFRTITLSPLTRYDEVHVPSLEVTFDR